MPFFGYTARMPLFSRISPGNWSGFDIVFVCETTFQKIELLIGSIKLPSVILSYLYKSTIQSCMEFCLHVLAAALNCYVDVEEAGEIELLGSFIPGPFSCFKQLSGMLFFSFLVTLSVCSEPKFLNF